MQRVFPEATVEGFEYLIPAMQNDAKDRHVVAAAVKAGAELIVVTNNLKDFSPLPSGVEATDPDSFLCDLFDLNPKTVVELLRQQAADLKNPPVAFDELLCGLSKANPKFATMVRTFAEHSCPEKP